MVAIPAHAAADMQQQFVEKNQQGGNFVCDRLGWVEMSAVEGQQDFPADGIGRVKLHRTSHI